MTADFGVARAIETRAYGEPGKRTFELRIVGSDDRSASLWLEKQQLQAMALAFTQLLTQLGQPERGSREIRGFPESAEETFRVGRMSIGFDASNNTVVLHIFRDTREEDEDDPDVLVRVSQDDCASLNTNLQEIIAAGRPACPLCGMPMDEGGVHMCVRANGHSKQPIPDGRLEDAEEE
jgi:uncharacterized repeat protein (TIGR03847 family)